MNILINIPKNQALYAVTDFPFNLTLLCQNEIRGLERLGQKQYEKQTCFFAQVETATYIRPLYIR